MSSSPESQSDILPLPERRGGTVLEILRHASQKHLDVQFATGEGYDLAKGAVVPEVERQARKQAMREHDAQRLVGAGLVLEVTDEDGQTSAAGVLTEVDTLMGVLVLTDESGEEHPVQYAEVVTYPDPVLIPKYIAPEHRSHDDEGNQIDVEWIPDGGAIDPTFVTKVSIRVLHCPETNTWLFRP